jgi:hypothetical protein
MERCLGTPRRGGGRGAVADGGGTWRQRPPEMRAIDDITALAAPGETTGLIETGDPVMVLAQGHDCR